MAEATAALAERSADPDWVRDRPDETEPAADETADEEAADEDEAAADDCEAAARATTVVLVMPIEPSTADEPVSAFLYWGRPKAPGMSVKFQPWLTIDG